MSNVDFASKISRQNEIYQKSLEDNRRNHKEEVEDLKKTHEYRETKQTGNHARQISKMEDSHKETSQRISADQKKSLKSKNEQYEKSINKNKSEFHDETRGNIKNWTKKFSELKDSFAKNLSDTQDSDQKVRRQLDRNYKDNIANIRKEASKDLDAYKSTTGRQKKESDVQFRTEKNEIITKGQNEIKDLRQEEIHKRNFLVTNGIRDGKEDRELQTKRFIDGKIEAENKFKTMNQDLNNRIDGEITTREEKVIKQQTADNRLQNITFQKQYDKVKKEYNKDVRNLEYQKRAEDISQGEVNKKIQAKYKDNMQTQVDLQRETQMRERFDVENAYGKRLEDTVESYQNTIRESNLATGEKVTKIESNSAEVNRSDRYEDKKVRDRTSHDHQVSLKYLEDKNASKEADEKKNTNKKVRSLKENFNRSMASAREKSKQNFDITKEAMLEDKRILEQRLHEQNSKENTFIKQVYGEKMEKMAAGYEQRIQSLELQNQSIQESSNETVKDILRKTNFEVDRQRKAAQSSAKNQVQTERALSIERQNSLKDRIKDLQANFTKKMNNQTISGRKKVKDTQFEGEQRLNSEVNRYQGIIDQNNKFMAREVQRLTLASDSEKQRLVTQYEDRITQMQKVYKDRNSEIEQYNELNKA